MHYLMRGEPDRKPQLSRFLQALHAGAPAIEAFRSSFQMEPAAMLAELLRYIRGNRFLYTISKFNEMKIPTETAKADIERAETLVRLGELLAQLEDRRGDAEEHYRAVLAEDASHAGALAGMAELRMHQGKDREALELFNGAMAAGASDFRVPYRYGGLLMRSVWERWNSARTMTQDLRDDVKAARAAFRSSIDRNPDFPEARAALGRSYLYEDGEGAAAGIPDLEAAVRRLPTRTDLVMDLATIYERTGQEAKADELLHQALGPEAQRVLQAKKKERDFHRELARFDELVAGQKGEEALALLEQLVRDAPPDMKPSLQKELMNLRVSVEDIRMVNRYNEAGELMAKGKYREALARFEDVAANARDPRLAASARSQIEWIRRRLADRKPKRQAS